MTHIASKLAIFQNSTLSPISSNKIAAIIKNAVLSFSEKLTFATSMPRKRWIGYIYIRAFSESPLYTGKTSERLKYILRSNSKDFS